MRADFVDHLRGPGFFTGVAATGVVGAQAIVLLGRRDVAWALWCAALLLWALLTYGIFAALTVKALKPPLERGINGGWLLAVVATQSIAVLSCLLAMGEAGPAKLSLNFLALSMWLAGGMLYVWIMARSLAPFVKGFTIFYWATATWWIPMLLVLVAWR